MCGLVGFLSPGRSWPEAEARLTIDAMAAAIAHRGPDDCGHWLEPGQSVGLGHRRLSIVDLSTGGHQPMVSADGRFVLVFNGEIYNHRDLRRNLEAAGSRFSSNSDTEVLVEAFSVWGVVAACKLAMGMFAFAAWDRKEARLWLARDRIGKKPLYLYMGPGGEYAFASELKSLWRYPGFRPTLDERALSEYFQFSYIPDYLSVFREVTKVMPGTVVELQAGVEKKIHTFWSLAEVVERQASQKIADPGEAEETLLSLLRDATRRRMLADVPLGAFLSGGIDSGLVVSLMQEANSSKVRTFSIGFREAAFDEAPVARAVAQHLGTEHTELYVTDEDAQRLVPQLPDIFDEPFADASQIPTCLLSRLTRAHVTVALTGDGGDESFGGYLRYRNQHGMVGRLYGLPVPLRRGIAHAIGGVPAGLWEAMTSVVPRRRRPRFIASKMAKVARALQLDGAAERGKAYLSFWNPAIIMRRPDLSVDPFRPPLCLQGDSSEMMQYWESLHYLPGDLLVKADRATMAASMEARSPLLDHRVVELAWRLPSSMKASPVATKHILRNLLFRYVPRQLVDLPKQGFSVPIGSWLATGLREWAEDALSYGRHATDDLINWREVDEVWRAHLAGRPGHAEKMWIVVMFCVWHRRWLGKTENH